VLLSGAGLLIKSFVRLQNVNPRFSIPRNVLTFEVSLPKMLYPDDSSIVRFNNEAQRRIARAAGSAGCRVQHDPAIDRDEQRFVLCD